MSGGEGWEGAGGSGEPAEGSWVLTLYVIRGSLLSSNAIAAIRRICAAELAGRVELRVVDIHEHPEALEDDQILAIPTLIKRLPPPLRRIVGDLSNEAVVRAALNLAPAPAAAPETGERAG